MPAALIAPPPDLAPVHAPRPPRRPSVAPAPDERARLVAALRGGGLSSTTALAKRIRRVQALDVEGRPSRPSRAAITDAIVRLRELDTAAALLDAAPAELCRAGGFSRAMVSRIRGGVWIPEVFHPTSGPLTGGFAAAQGRPIPLRVMAVETELARRRVPLLVPTPRTDRRVSDAFLRAARCDGSYAVAPIISGGRVIGFFHADRMGQGVEVDAEDRDAAATFADQFGMLFERLTISARLARQSAELDERLRQVAAVADQLCRREPPATVDGAADERPAGPRRAGGVPAAVSLLLTARETEVLELVASGATNRQIAVGLTVAEGTVKSHVKRIHQKLHVRSRSEAAAWYLRQLRRA